MIHVQFRVKDKHEIKNICATEQKKMKQNTLGLVLENICQDCFVAILM